MRKTNKLWKSLFVLMVIIASSCSKGDDSTNSTSSGTVTDIDGNIYHTVTLGTQVWMVENLKTTKYRNGDPIPSITDLTVWANLTTGAQCNYNNDATIGLKYGKLYNGYAVNDSRNIAPTGWHIPTNAEWMTLENYVTANLGTSGSIAKALGAKTDWTSDNDAGSIGNDLTKNNVTGFTALPGGCRGYLFGIYHPHDYVNYGGYWWSITINPYIADCYYLNYDSSNLNGWNFGANNGFSVRCVRN